MSYIGNIPTTVAFLVDTFSGNGSTTAFTLSQAPANTSSILVAVSGVVQDPSTYSVSGTTLTFSGAPPSGSSNISVRFLGIPASGVVNTAYRTVTEFTATSGQTTFSVPSYTAGFIDVYRNGVMLGSADYTATSGTTVVLASGATAGDLVEVISFNVASVLNAMSPAGGTFTGSVQFAGGNGIWNASGNVGVGTTSPFRTLDVRGFISSSDGTTRTEMVNGGGVGYIGTQSNHPLAFQTNNAEVARIATNGQQSSIIPGFGTMYQEFQCRAWVNFNGAGTVAIRASGNVSSITDNDTGDYTINFTTAMPDANYSVAGSTGGTGGAFLWRTYDDATPRTSSLFRISTINLSASQIDPPQVNLSVFR